MFHTEFFIGIKKSAQDPTRASIYHLGTPPQHLAALRASVKRIRHTSSKGMPRHAYGRWALINGWGRRLDVSKAVDGKVTFRAHVR